MSGLEFILCDEVVSSQSLVHSDCQLGVVQFVLGFLVALTQVDALVNFLLLLWGDCSVVSRRWNRVFGTLSRALYAALRHRSVSDTTRYWNLLGVDANRSVVSGFRCALFVCILLTNLFIKVLHALLRKNISSG